MPDERYLYIKIFPRSANIGLFFLWSARPTLLLHKIVVAVAVMHDATKLLHKGPAKQPSAQANNCSKQRLRAIVWRLQKRKKKTYALHFYIAKLPLTGESETLNNKLQFVRGWAVCLKKKKRSPPKNNSHPCMKAKGHVEENLCTLESTLALKALRTALHLRGKWRRILR